MCEKFAIREAGWPADEAAAISFIIGLQHYEHAFEPDRRIDPGVGAEYFAALMKRVAEQQGRVFIAEADGEAIGWAVFVVDQNSIYVVAAQRTHGYIAELFIVERARGHGIGRALIAACEAEARKRGLTLMMIGVVPANQRAASVYARAGYAPYAMQLRKRL